MGFVFGIFLGAMGDMQPLQMVNGREVPQAPLREQVTHMQRTFFVENPTTPRGGTCTGSLPFSLPPC